MVAKERGCAGANSYRIGATHDSDKKPRRRAPPGFWSTERGEGRPRNRAVIAEFYGSCTREESGDAPGCVWGSADSVLVLLFLVSRPPQLLVAQARKVLERRARPISWDWNGSVVISRQGLPFQAIDDTRRSDHGLPATTGPEGIPWHMRRLFAEHVHESPAIHCSSAPATSPRQLSTHRDANVARADASNQGKSSETVGEDISRHDSLPRSSS
ncbi:hypothetical protein FB567DRAFT_550529 [Paraphoma chrysanthemicola]|uniref:Uncharacterized protein n=1 Tax=Paraphoma chrysanthemicola TaxID=798071 RepID=A0A8K0VXF0_9PLEO|nr:hypothetical protein FB567DRAFT_550529 [Paraphoma chrysanthemicola]